MLTDEAPSISRVREIRTSGLMREEGLNNAVPLLLDRLCCKTNRAETCYFPSPMFIPTFSPNITKRKNGLSISSTLFVVNRRVIVNVERKRLLMLTRYFWFWKVGKGFDFEEIEAITYGYRGSASLSASRIFAQEEGAESFDVGLRLVDDTEIHLFTFLGAARFVNNGQLPDWCYWDEMIFDIVGEQEAESRVLVDVLCKLIGVTVVPPQPGESSW